VLDGGSWREVAEGCHGALKTDEMQAVVLNQTTVFDWATMPLNLTKHGINKKTHLPFRDGETPAIVWTGRVLVAFAKSTPIVVSRSTTLGAAWSAPKALVQGASNPAPVWDERGKKIIFMYKSGDVYKVVESRDEALTWEAPRRICDGCEVDGKPLMKRWGFQLPGPPGGIVASSGRILQCCDHVLKGTDVCTMGSDACNKGNHVLFSDNRGLTWNVSGLAAEGPPIFGDECSIAQLPGTDILVMNSRVDSNNNSLTMCVTPSHTPAVACQQLSCA
jgi:hypothetical protein